MMVPGYVSGVPFLVPFGIGCGVCCLVNQNRRDINKNPPGSLPKNGKAPRRYLFMSFLYTIIR